jgi:hypothetical protein
MKDNIVNIILFDVAICPIEMGAMRIDQQWTNIWFRRCKYRDGKSRKIRFKIAFSNTPHPLLEAP